MRLYVGLTDSEWHSYLENRPDFDEVNFWQPSAHPFKALSPGEIFLFKLHGKRAPIVGGGFFARKLDLPVSMAWNSFGEKNGAGSLVETRKRIERYRRIAPKPDEDYVIGCIMLVDPLFFEERDYMEEPSDWSSPIQQGKGYDHDSEVGARLWKAVMLRIEGKAVIGEARKAAYDQPKYGPPQIILPRKGQGIFRWAVVETYSRACAVTNERALPALNAAHIQPFAEDGPNDIKNGILLRSDIHQLLDSGYVTITPDYHFEVSKRIKDEFDNGHEYFKLHGHPLRLPTEDGLRPSQSFIKWHNEKKYRR